MSNKSQKNRTKKEKKIKEVGQSQMSPPSMPDSPYNRGPVNGGHYRLENAKTPDRYVNLEESLEVEMAKMIALLEKKTAEMSQALDEGDPAEATRGDPHPARMFWFPVKDEFSDKFPNKVNVMGQSKKNKYVDLSKGIPEDRDEDIMNPKHASGAEKPGAVNALEKALLAAKDANEKLSYSRIDKIMQNICHKYHLTGDKLHDDFVKKHHAVPDNWIKQQKVTEATENKCPPATQDISINLENRQKAIDQYGYGPLNPDLPNKKFWMMKVEEWNLDSPDEAKQSLCGNCAAFDQRKATLDCIAKGIGSTQGSKDPTIDAGDLGYCRFLKFKCASRRTCDAWVTGGPLTDEKSVDEGSMSRAAKGIMKYGKKGMKALAKAGREGASEKRLDNIRDKYDHYNENVETLEEKWSQKYKRSINCSHPKGFSQKAHCAGKKKHSESIEMEMTCPDCGMCETHGNTTLHKVEQCPECGDAMYPETMLHEKQDACYYKVKSRYKVWPSAYASGALVKCRKKGAKNWGTKNESTEINRKNLDENLHQWFKDKWVRFGPDGKIRGDCARGSSSEGKPKCLPQSKAHSLGPKGRASAAKRKRDQDPNPERKGKAINVATKEASSPAQQAAIAINMKKHHKKPKNQGMSEDTAQSDKGKNILNESQRFLKQYKITSENIDKSDVADAYISPDDPINELKIIQYLAGLNAESRLAEYREHQKQINKGSNISVTAEEKAKIMKENNIQPGTPEWFRLWFSLPFMTGEKPIDKET